MNVLDLSNDDVKNQFSNFLMLWMLRQGVSAQHVASRSGISVRQLKRYLPGPQNHLPRSIPLNTFNVLLKTLDKTYEDFHSYYIDNVTESKPAGRWPRREERVPGDEEDFRILENRFEPATKPNVLWVDDTPDNNSMLIAFMIARGVSVKTVITTEDAMGCFRLERYDQIISDMGRPEGSYAGLDLTRRIRALDNTVPIHIFCGGWAARHLRCRAIEAGANSITSSAETLLNSFELNFLPDSCV